MSPGRKANNGSRPPAILRPNNARSLLLALHRAHPRVAAVAYLAYYCGLRNSEARACTWSWIHDLDSPASTLHVPAGATKTNTDRDVPIPTPLRLYLLDLRATQRLDPPVDIPAPWPLVLNRWGRSPSARYIQRALLEVSRADLGFSVRLHHLRHSYADHLLCCSNLRCVQLALGHRSIRSTQIYTHPSLTDLREAISKAFDALTPEAFEP